MAVLGFVPLCRVRQFCLQILYRPHEVGHLVRIGPSLLGRLGDSLVGARALGQLDRLAQEFDALADRVDRIPPDGAARIIVGVVRMLDKRAGLLRFTGGRSGLSSGGDFRDPASHRRR